MNARRSCGLGGTIAAFIPLTICAVMLSSAAADAAVTGAITGTVTAPRGTQIVVTICAGASGGAESCTTTLATDINGNSPGPYTISGLASGEYEVRFVARCSVEPCPETFPPQYYDDQISVAKATPVKLTAPETLAGIDASIETQGESKVREYLEDRGEAKPVGEVTGVGPGAIQPLPVNQKVEEEFWAHPPWDTGTSSVPSTPAAGVAVAVAASTADVKGAGAEVLLHCAGASGCAGMLALVKTVVEKRLVSHDGKRVEVKRPLRILFGTTRFSLDAGASETVRVHLTRIGQARLHAPGGKGLKVELTGSGIKTGALVLK